MKEVSDSIPQFVKFQQLTIGKSLGGLEIPLFIIKLK